MKKSLIGSMFALVVSLPLTAQAQQVIMVPMAPPPPQQEAPAPMTAPGSTWVPGNWVWNGNQYVWQQGHWDRPPAMGARWMPARWVRRGRMWMYAPGRWRGPRGYIMQPGMQPGMPGQQPVFVQQPQPQTVVVAQPQPPMVVQQPPMVVQQPPMVVQQPGQPVIVGQPMYPRHRRGVVVVQQPGYPPGQPGYPVGQPGYPVGQPGVVVAQPGVPVAQPVQQPQTVIVQQPQPRGVVVGAQGQVIIRR